MPEISVKDQLKKLVSLQKIDTEIYESNTALKEMPLLIEELKNEFEEKKAHLNTLQDSFKRIQLQRKEYELVMNTKDGEIAKANGDLSQIKTNKEYTAKINEIEHIKADKSQIEEKILISYDDADEATAEIEKEKLIVDEEEKSYLAKKSEADSEIQVLKSKVKELEEKRKIVAPEVDPNCLNRYDRILKNKKGTAIVPLQANSCAGCFMIVNPQTINAVKICKQIIECDMCSRILYLEDELD